MKQVWLAFLILAGLLVQPPARAESNDIAAAGRGVVRVVLVTELGGEMLLVGHGSGFAVTRDRIVTNAHVVKAAQQDDRLRIAVVPPEGQSGWFAKVEAFSPSNDLALLKLTEAEGALPPLSLFTGDVGDGSDVFAVGYPGNVDQAQGLTFQEIVSPTSPVKTRGNFSTGRSARGFSTLLHTAAIGSGNSGGPLLDGCGRVIGVNSFGTVSDVSDSEFYFAVSTREVLAFLRKANVKPRLTAVRCRSMEDLERDEALRATSEEVASQGKTLAEREAARARSEAATRQALFSIIADRENGLAIALVALLLGTGSGIAGYRLSSMDRPRDTRIAYGAAGALALVAVIAWIARPGFERIEVRTQELLASVDGSVLGNKIAAGQLICSLDPRRSRLTVSQPTDISLDWNASGCAGGKDQYGQDASGWIRLTIPQAEETVRLTRFDQTSGQLRVDNYFPGQRTMKQMREGIAALPSPACGASQSAASNLAAATEELASRLPEQPNERLVYQCRTAQSGPAEP